ncbi:hypothetical protein QP027_02525 [Corynebacterium breve]|uniref:Integral membrane protein n=1 Tax=Corynebacterium breve TaxID=3049799 RepID=A0ABY8VF76_9CORY|nr:hypothetical protein [Corynebacterium breve]WIM68296.1 hypothetical protein QP027_02525 [Corynebacterium breve]
MTNKSTPAGTQPPSTLRWAAIVAIVQSLVVLGYALSIVVRELLGEEDQSLVSDSPNAEYVGYGTAIFLAIIFGTVIAGAVSLLRGKNWGRGPIVLIEFILLGVAFFMFQGGAIILGIVTLLSAVLALAMIFHPRSTEWIESHYGA